MADESKAISERKHALRAKLKQARRLIPREERERVDAAITAQLVATDAYAQASVVLTYLSFGSEIDTYGLIERAWADGKTVALPRCLEGTRQMEWYRIESFDGFRRSSIGVLEPVRDPAQRLAAGGSADELVVVPGLTFDTQGYRLGYGGGYYDTFLAGFPGRSAGLCRICQLSRGLQAEGVIDAYDLPVNVVVTEGGVIEVS
ncbi:MAG: 5-formyltetrahydrofolate cyclo-ligase [Atopobiaceae bacterium]|nr:5-formyltetrahydrofolate cyclo-ligase [Atopobiaceae bacterium]